MTEVLESQMLLIPQLMRAFVFAGNARFTIRSKDTGTRYTYRVNKGKNPGKPVFFCSLLTGPDNSSSYTYFGQFFGTVEQGLKYVHGKPAQGRPSRSAESVKAFAYVIGNLIDRERLPDGVEFWHEGSCGRCGRPLTVPESVESGFGPECRGKVFS